MSNFYRWACAFNGGVWLVLCAYTAGKGEISGAMASVVFCTVVGAMFIGYLAGRESKEQSK